jgi:NAD(P)-dependent dehydrogenase (short-subunit alcohol dehydrogenase family)
LKSFDKKVAVITGGASGIGRGCALALARQGARVAILDLNDARAGETAEEAVKAGVDALPLHCDIASDESVASARTEVLNRFGRVDILINNAGVLPVGAFENTPIAEWERVMQINFISVVRCTQAFLPELLASGDGHIVNTASLAGLFAYDPLTLAYGAAKAAVVSLSEGLAIALKSRSVGVTCLCPGPVATNIGEQIRAFGPVTDLGAYARRNFTGRTPDAVGQLVVAAIRDGRFLLPTNDEVIEELRDHGGDPEGFVSRIAAFLEMTSGGGAQVPL